MRSMVLLLFLQKAQRAAVPEPLIREEERDNTIHNFAAAGSEGTKKSRSLWLLFSLPLLGPPVPPPLRKTKKRKGKGQGSSYLFTFHNPSHSFSSPFCVYFSFNRILFKLFFPQVFEQILMGASGFNSSFPNSASVSAVGEGMRENGK